MRAEGVCEGGRDEERKAGTGRAGPCWLGERTREMRRTEIEAQRRLGILEGRRQGSQGEDTDDYTVEIDLDQLMP